MSRTSSHLLVMLLITGGVFFIGAVQKSPCANAGYAATGSGPRFPCYSDLAVLLGSEQLSAGRVPYVDACIAATRPCDEYPVLTMFAMYGAAQVAGTSYATFFRINVALMLACALLIAWTLERMGARTLLFAAAPALALYGTLNWDLIAVAAATLGTYLLLRQRNVLSGTALGFGAAAKLYPVLLVFPFALHRVRQSRKRQGWLIVASTAGAWALVDAPFAIAKTAPWSEVFRFNGQRGVDFESIWTATCQVGVCPSTRTLNLVIPVIVVCLTWAIWRFVVKGTPAVPRWLLGFPLLVILIVVGKFWSPQYALWLLPWFAVSRIPLRVWLVYQMSEVLEFVTRSAFMMDSLGSRVSLTTLSLTVLLRAVLLLRCLWVWMRDPLPPSEVIAEPVEQQRAAAVA